jgi:trans-2,3-dihydro-3-hydroxyanthranilate isomerase
MLDPPPQIVSAGNPFLFVALRDPGLVDSVVLDLAALERAVPPTETTGHFVFAPTPGGAYSRMFAPRAGIAEDPATGSGTGPLAAYMARYGLIPLRDGERFTSTQGVHMGRPSKLHVILHVCGEALEFVEVGGSAVRLVDATLTLPAETSPLVNIPRGPLIAPLRNHRS